MKRKLVFSVLFALALAGGLAACGSRPTPTAEPPTATPVPATATQAATAAPVEVTVVVPVTVIVPQTVVVTATPEPATPVPPTPEPSATPEAAATSADATEAPTEALSTPSSAVTPQLAALPAINSTPQALNGPDPMAGVTSQQFAEYFAPPDFWGTGSDADASVSIADGKMTMVNKKLQSFAWTFNGIKGTDFYSQVFVTPKLCGFGDNYGLVFHAKDDANLNLFGISCEGKYRLLEISQGKTRTVVDWTDSKYIRKFETTNVVGVRAVGDQISLYVNNYFLATVTAGANLEGRFGLYVGNIKTPDLTVFFQALTASRVSP